jgi:hypothetical protein
LDGSSTEEEKKGEYAQDKTQETTTNEAKLGE